MALEQTACRTLAKSQTHHGDFRCAWMVEDEPDLHLKLPPALEVVDFDVVGFPDERVVEGVEDGLVLDVGAVVSPAARLDLHLIDLPEVQLPLHHRPAHL